MNNPLAVRCVLVGILALVLLVPGCKKPKASSDSSDSQAGNNNASVLQAPQAGGAVQNVRNAVLRVGVETDLKQLALLYTNYTLTNNKPPASLADLPDVQRQLPKLYEEITKGDVIVYWNADPNRMPNGSNTVFAHVKPNPNASTLAAFLDGSVRNLSAAEFDKTAKAGK